jgi:hypothetical protein
VVCVARLARGLRADAGRLARAAVGRGTDWAASARRADCCGVVASKELSSSRVGGRAMRGEEAPRANFLYRSAAALHRRDVCWGTFAALGDLKNRSPAKHKDTGVTP